MSIGDVLSKLGEVQKDLNDIKADVSKTPAMAKCILCIEKWPG